MGELNDKSIFLKITPVDLFTSIVIVSASTLILFLTDLVIGSELSFSIFYLIPITLAVFLYGKSLGIVFSAVCSIAWICADIFVNTHYSSILIPIWNTLVRFGYFIFHTVLISNLLHKIKQIRNISLHDPLTGAANWRYFEEYSNMIIKNSLREKHKITLAYFDIDNFKNINDLFGHSIGDEVLVSVSRIINSEIRPTDLLARLGGDEFAILLNNTTSMNSKEIITRIQNKVRKEMLNRKWNVSLSIGAKVFSVLPFTIGPMLKDVDDLMYEVKKNGKNDFKIVEQLV